MVFKPGTDDLFAVVQILGADKADYGVDQKRLEMPRHRIGARLTGLLIDTKVRISRQRTALACLEIHQVVAQCAAIEA